MCNFLGLTEDRILKKVFETERKMPKRKTKIWMETVNSKDDK
jgi:hypothetical protein